MLSWNVMCPHSQKCVTHTTLIYRIPRSILWGITAISLRWSGFYPAPFGIARMTRQIPRWCQTSFTSSQFWDWKRDPFPMASEWVEAFHQSGDLLCLTQLPGPCRGLGLEERRRIVLAGGMCAVTWADAWKWVAWS